jgi:hypothetical protein
MENTQQNTADRRATVVITYNSVRDFPAGTYEGKSGPVIIHSHDNTSTWYDEAEGKLGSIMHGIFGRVTPEDVKQVYIYAGLYAKNGALRAAERLAGEIGKLTLVACDCDAGEKKAIANRLKAPVIWSECGGRRTLAEIVRKELVKA